MKTVIFFACVALFSATVYADCYMHNPRGSNNRLNDKNQNAQNQNRLFDSQNNAKGGYHGGPKLNYYVDSILPVEYTHQHSCGMGNLENCEMVIQYMCGANVRDGDLGGGANARQTPDPNDVAGNANKGLHESEQYYLDCLARPRNKGLFIADQNLDDTIGATSTRQNAGGTRYGMECPEERDYYPYWEKTPWKDIAITTHNATRCTYYQTESENVKGRGTNAAHGLPAPECIGSIYSRDNENGNSPTGFAPMVNITIPNDVNDNCVMRIRYNVSTADFDAWATDSASNGNNSPVTNDPQIDIGDGRKLQLAINTAQFGRTFQDRSHTFNIKASEAPDTCVGALVNLNVRGRRGNIEQANPAVEYDFVPQIVEAPSGVCIHIQWTGSDYNDNNAAGEGTAGTDRSNMIQQKNNNPKVMYPAHKDDFTMITDAALAEGLALLGQNDATLNNAETPYWDAGIVAFNTQGEYNYMCTRNNNFTNRGQRGTFRIGYSSSSPAQAAAIGVGVGILALSAALGGAAIYARSHPSSRVAAVFNRRGSMTLSSGGSATAGGRSWGAGGSRGGNSRGSRGSRGSSGKRSRSKGSRSHSKGSRSRSRGSR